MGKAFDMTMDIVKEYESPKKILEDALRGGNTAEELKAAHIRAAKSMRALDDLNHCFDAAVRDIYGEKELERFMEASCARAEDLADNMEPIPADLAWIINESDRPLNTAEDRARMEIEELRAFGYTDEITPITVRLAEGIFTSGSTVYLLHPNNTKEEITDASMIYEAPDRRYGVTEDQIYSFMDQLFGLDKEEGYDKG
jgi:hypothetical protein